MCDFMNYIGSIIFLKFLNTMFQVMRYGQLLHEPLWSRLVIKLSHLLLSLSSATNILIYSLKVKWYTGLRPLLPFSMLD